MALNLSKWVDVSFTDTAKSDSLNIARDLLPDKVDNWLGDLFGGNDKAEEATTQNTVSKVRPPAQSNKTLYWILGGTALTVGLIVLLKNKKKI